MVVAIMIATIRSYAALSPLFDIMCNQVRFLNIEFCEKENIWILKQEKLIILKIETREKMKIETRENKF